MTTNALKSATQAISGPNVRRLMRLPAVIEATGMSRSTIYDRIRKEPDFPKPIPLGRQVGHPRGTRSTMVAWLADEVDAYIAARTAERDQALAYR